MSRKAWLSVAAVAMASALLVTLLTGMLRDDGQRASGTAVPVDRAASPADPGLAAVERAATTARASAPAEPAPRAVAPPPERPAEAPPAPTERGEACTYGEAVSSSLACSLQTEAVVDIPAEASNVPPEHAGSPWRGASAPTSPR